MAIALDESSKAAVGAPAVPRFVAAAEAAPTLSAATVAAVLVAPPATVKVASISPVSAVMATAVVTAPAVATLKTASNPFPALTVDVSKIKYVQPALGIAVAKIPVIVDGVPRASLTAPVCPAREFNDGLLLESPADPALKHYLPQYDLGQENASGQLRVQMSLRNTEQGPRLSLTLKKRRHRDLEVTGRAASELPHEVAVKLSFRVGTAGGPQAEKEIELDVIRDGESLHATYRPQGLAELNQLFLVLTSPDYQARLLVRRKVRVALPVDTSPRVTQLRGEIAEIEKELNGLRHRLHLMSAIRQKAVYTTKAPLPTSAVILKSPRSGKRAPSTKAVDRIKFKKPIDDDGPGFPPLGDYDDEPTQLAIQKLMARLSKAQEELSRLETTPLFRETDQVRDHQVDPAPFAFPPALYGYVFAIGQAPPAGGPALIRHTVPWKGTPYPYLQEAGTNRFYYLPESFKLARENKAERRPLMTLRARPNEAEADPKVMLQYFGAPYVDGLRIADALPTLRALLEPSLRAAGPVLAPLMTRKAQLRLAFPRAEGAAGGPFTARAGAAVDLQSGIVDEVPLSKDQFASVYQTMYGAGAELFEGRVDVDLGDVTHQVPFLPRLDDTVGDVFAYQETWDPAAGVLKAVLTNAIESPVRLTRVGARLAAGDSMVPATLRNLTLPVLVAPGASLALELAPAQPLPPGKPVTAVWELDPIDVEPDAVRLLAAITDKSPLPTYPKTVDVRTFVELFDEPAESNLPVHVLVDFEGGDTVRLDRTTLGGRTALRVRFVDMVLSTGDEGKYRYRVQVVRRDGKAYSSDWREDDSSQLQIIDLP